MCLLEGGSSRRGVQLTNCLWLLGPRCSVEEAARKMPPNEIPRTSFRKAQTMETYFIGSELITKPYRRPARCTDLETVIAAAGILCVVILGSSYSDLQI